MKILALSGGLRAGSIKNALDWLVGCAPIAGKRVAVLNTSPRSWTADTALRAALSALQGAIASSD